MQKQSTVEVFTNLFKLATKAIFNKIASSKPLLDSFDSAYESLLPTIVKFPQNFIPTFVGIASCNDDFCDRLLQERLLKGNDSLQVVSKRPGLSRGTDTLMNLISELLLIKSGRQGARFQTILTHLLLQSDLMAVDGESLDHGQNDFNLKLIAVFTQCATQIV